MVVFATASFSVVELVLHIAPATTWLTRTRGDSGHRLRRTVHNCCMDCGAPTFPTRGWQHCAQYCPPCVPAPGSWHRWPACPLCAHNPRRLGPSCWRTVRVCCMDCGALTSEGRSSARQGSRLRRRCSTCGSVVRLGCSHRQRRCHRRRRNNNNRNNNNSSSSSSTATCRRSWACCGGPREEAVGRVYGGVRRLEEAGRELGREHPQPVGGPRRRVSAAALSLSLDFLLSLISLFSLLSPLSGLSSLSSSSCLSCLSCLSSLSSLSFLTPLKHQLRIVTGAQGSAHAAPVASAHTPELAMSCPIRAASRQEYSCPPGVSAKRRTRSESAEPPSRFPSRRLPK